jgi:hypothetical protein
LLGEGEKDSTRGKGTRLVEPSSWLSQVRISVVLEKVTVALVTPPRHVISATVELMSFCTSDAAHYGSCFHLMHSTKKVCH